MTDAPEPPVLHAVDDDEDPRPEGDTVRRGPPDGVECRKDGTVRITLDDGDYYTLRRPKVGEYAKLRELLQERTTEQVEASMSAQRRQMERQFRAQAFMALRAKVTDEMTAEEVARHHDALLSAHDTFAADRVTDVADGEVLLSAAEHSTRTWLIEVVRLLAMDRDPPTEDELPIWTGADVIVQTLTTQWEAVPPPRGVR